MSPISLKNIFKGLLIGMTLVASIMVGLTISTKYLKSTEIAAKTSVEAGRFIEIGDTFIIGDTAYIQIYDSIGSIDSRSFWSKVKHLKCFNIKRVVIYINSQGGVLPDAFAIIDTIIELKNQGIIVEAHVRGIALSAAIPIVSVCSRRIAGKDTMFFVHNARLNIIDQSESDRLGLQMFAKKYVNFLAAHTNLSAKEWKLKMIEEVWFDSRTALKWGLIDEILEEKEM